MIPFNENTYETYRTPLFQEIFPSATDFSNFYSNNEVFPTSLQSSTSIGIIYGLLYARYGNNPIASDDINKFKISVMSIIYTYGPTWEKKLDIQTKLRALTDDQIREGTLQQFGAGQYSGAKLSLDSISETEGINNYSGQKYTKSAVEGYSTLYTVLDDNITEEFVKRFKGLFLKVFLPSDTLKYEVYKGDF